MITSMRREDAEKVTILLSKVTDAGEFNRQASLTKFGIEAQSGSYIVDAKSLMGLFSLDLSKPIELAMLTDDDKQKNDFKYRINKFIVA